MLLPSDPAELSDLLAPRGYGDGELRDRLALGHEELVHACLFDVPVAGANHLSDDQVRETLLTVTRAFK